jgi:hypothetical protein
MISHEEFVGRDIATADRLTTRAPGWISSMGKRLSAWAKDRANEYTSALLYEQLSALSDRELGHRGLSRGTLAHDIDAACRRDGRS